MPPSRDDATSSEMRHDWLSDRWVIVAPQRTARPIDFVRQPTQIIPDQNCPFCFGHELQTPEAVACYLPHQQHSATPKWHVRVVPNKFPAVSQSSQSNLVAVESLAAVGLHSAHQDLTPEQTIEWTTSTEFSENESVGNSLKLFQRRNLNGGHEVIIEGPNHLQSLSQLDGETVSLVFQAYRDRLKYWLSEQSIAYAVVFKNVGQEAGASLVHSHSQLISTDIVPTDVTRSIQRMELFHDQEGVCLFCRTVQDELLQEVRVVEETANYIAYCPFASRLPAAVTITSKKHVDRFETLSNELLDQLSALVHRMVRRIEKCFPDAAYNYVVHTAPLNHQGSPSFHWRMELFPRISTQAGFEWGSECFINPIPPESAAQQLRLARG